MEKHSLLEYGLELMLATDLKSVCPRAVRAPPWASVSVPVKWDDNRGEPGLLCRRRLAHGRHSGVPIAQSPPGIASLLLHLSLPRALC